MKISIGSDGGKTCQFMLSGELSKNVLKPELILAFDKLHGRPTKMRLDGLQYMIQEKGGFKIWWKMLDGSYELLVVLESRGGFDFEKIYPISSPSGAIGLSFTTFKFTDTDMSFVIMMDFSKQ